MANDTTPAPLADGSTLPLTGKLVTAVVNNFTKKPFQGDDTWEHCSIGAAVDSIVATDANSAIIIGKPRKDHVATQRKEVLLGAQRAKFYGEPFDIDGIPRNMDEQTGVAKPMPEVQEIIKGELAGMKSIGLLNPFALLAVAKVAIAAGAWDVELFQPVGDGKRLGFEFSFAPDEDHQNLFSEWDEMIRARGVFKSETRVAAKREEELDDEDEDEDEDSREEAPKPKARPRRGQALPVATVAGEGHADAPPAPPEEPEPLADISAVVQRGAYQLPPLGLLEVRLAEAVETGSHQDAIMSLLRQKNIPGRFLAAKTGPRLTQYQIQTPGAVSVKKVASLDADLQMHLGVESVRIQAPIPGKQAIGIEIPNAKPRMVSLLDLCARRAFLEKESRLWFVLGEDIGGNPMYADLASTPHLLVAGATNSGKSIGLATIITSLLLRNTPKDLRFVMIDPKQVELTLFDRIPHLMCPVITDMKEAAGVLRAVWREMDRRYDLLKDAGVRNIVGYNGQAAENDKLPYIVVVIDELADLMMTCGAEVETVIVRLAQKARAVGIHLVIATQRPSVDVVTGLIKANVPSRIAFGVASGVDSKVILDQTGAEKLLGKGDMLFSSIEGGGKTLRAQGAYVSEMEVDKVCKHWRDQATPEYTIALDEDEKPKAAATADDGSEPLWQDAVRWALDRGDVSTSMLQRKFTIGYQRASRLLDLMEERGVIGPRDGTRPRSVILAAADVEAMLGGANG